MLESAHERCKHEAMLLFNAQIHADTLQWIEQESVYRAQRALAESEIQHRYMDVAIQNQRKVEYGYLIALACI